MRSRWVVGLAAGPYLATAAKRTMRARGLRTVVALAAAAAALIVAALGVAGCGGVGVSGASSTIGNQLTIYSSLPLQGPSGPNSQQIVDGEKLALSEAGGRIGPFKISYLSMDDSNTNERRMEPRRDRDEREDGRRGHHHDRLPGRLQLGRERSLAAADQRLGHPADQPVEPVCRADLLARRRPG